MKEKLTIGGHPVTGRTVNGVNLKELQRLRQVTSEKTNPNGKRKTAGRKSKMLTPTPFVNKPGNI